MSKAALKNEKRKQKKLEEKAAGNETGEVEAATKQVEDMKLKEVRNRNCLTRQCLAHC